MKSESTPVPNFFRAGAAAVISNHSGQILCFERTDHPGAWQLPQGGLKAGEEPLQAVYREIFEETALASNQLALLNTHPEPLAYELPLKLRNPKVGRGQVLYWFLFRLLGNVSDIELSRGKEFRSWQWMSFSRLQEIVVEFRQPVYRRVAHWVQLLHFQSGVRPPPE